VTKRVEHGERRRTITDAVARIVAREGIKAVTMRAVAAEAGVSVGRVQHYFASKDELLAAAAGHDDDQPRAGRLGPRASERDRLRAVLLALLPLDEQRRTTALLRRTLQAGAAHGDPPLAATDADELAIRARLEAADATGELRPGIDVARETLHLSCTVSGLTDRLLAGRAAPAEVTRTIDELLARTHQKAPVAPDDQRAQRVDGADAPPDTAMRILRAAERLFAEQGIDRASLRDVLRDAGQSNAGAVQYYFGDRRGLVRAVILRHRRDEEVQRNALLDAYERAGPPDLRALADALVQPLAAKLDDRDGGRHYLRIAAEYFVNLPPEENATHPIPDTSVTRWHGLLNELADEDVLADPMQLFVPRLLAIRLVLIHLSLLAASEPGTEDPLTISYLVDLVRTVLATRPSSQSTTLHARQSHLPGPGR
jgi:AcrR family transcriptional regulator